MSICKIENCSEPLNAGGYCRKHYMRWKKYGDPLYKGKTVFKYDKCTIDGCENLIVSRGYCRTHYSRWRKTGDPLVKPSDLKFVSKEGPCSASGCDKPRYNKGYCKNHYYRFWKYGVATGGRQTPIKKRGEGTKNNGYHFTSVYVNGTQRQIGTHRLVMEQKLGRKLRKNENIHHINGIRDDNRPENLELWVKSQPCGQRPEDLVKWAREILSLYEGEVNVEAL